MDRSFYTNFYNSFFGIFYTYSSIILNMHSIGLIWSRFALPVPPKAACLLHRCHRAEISVGYSSFAGLSKLLLNRLFHIIQNMM